MIWLASVPTFSSVPGFTSTQLCGTTSGLLKTSRTGSPAFTLSVFWANVKFLPASMLTDRAPGIVLRHGLGTALAISARSLRIGWAAMVRGTAR